MAEKQNYDIKEPLGLREPSLPLGTRLKLYAGTLFVLVFALGAAVTSVLAVDAGETVKAVLFFGVLMGAFWFGVPWKEKLLPVSCPDCDTGCLREDYAAVPGRKILNCDKCDARYVHHRKSR